MRNFLATVLSVIAVGVLLIAYGLLSPRVNAMDAYGQARPMLASQRVGDLEVLTPRQALAYRVNELRAVDDAPIYVSRRAPVYSSRDLSDESRSANSSAGRSVRTAPRRRVAEAPRRDWARTAMVIGGTSAAGAGLGAIFGGKKGALIGAAIGGGAGTLYEIRKR